MLLSDKLLGRAYERAGEKVKGYQLLEYIDLGDLLLKVILWKDNWDNFFEPVFKSKEFVERRAKIILEKRNSIAHSRILSQQDIHEFVVMTRGLLSIMQPFLKG